MKASVRKLYVCGICVEVHLRNDGDVMYEGDKTFGVYDKDQERIDVDVRVPRRVWLKTLIHEIGHAGVQSVQGSYQLAGSKDIEEAYVRVMEVTYFSLLTDGRNRWLWRELDAVREEI